MGWFSSNLLEREATPLPRAFPARPTVAQSATAADREAALSGMVPKCSICSLAFVASDKLVMSGTGAKQHAQCAAGGAPPSSGGGLRPPPAPPRDAARRAPELLTVRIALPTAIGATSSARALTYFFVRQASPRLAPERAHAGSTSTASAPAIVECVGASLRTRSVGSRPSPRRSASISVPASNGDCALASGRTN